MVYPLTGIVLAGGKSTRMGADKALLPLRGQNFLTQRLNYLKPYFDECMAVLDPSDHYELQDVSLAFDRYLAKGPLGGIHAGLLSARHAWCFVTACDMPYWDGALLEQLIAEREDYDCVVPQHQGKFEPLFALYRKSCLPQIEELLNSECAKVQSLFTKVKTKYLEFDSGSSADSKYPNAFVNINTPEDYHKFKQPCPVLSIVAKSGTGKTTLIEKLIPELKSRGIRLAVVKHDAHQFEMDYEGKDTWRFTQAGADVVALSAPQKFALIEVPPQEQSLDAILARITDVDLILTEGYKTERKPKIEVVRVAKGTELISHTEDLVAIASDVPINIGVPCHDINDIKSIVGEVIQFMQKHKMHHSN